MWDELWVVPAALAQTESQASPSQKKMAEEGVKGKIHWPLPHPCLHSWSPAACAGLCWVTRLIVPSRTSLPAFSRAC